MGDFIRYNYVEILITIAIAAILIGLYYVLRTKRNRFKTAYYWYLILYSFARFWIEGLRVDSLMIGNLRISQVVSLLVFIIILFYNLKKKINSTTFG